MAEFMTFTPEQQQEFKDWVAARPPAIQEAVAKYPPNRLYRLKSCKHRVCIQSYEENETSLTVTVFVSGKYNLCAFERNVFGISLEDLEECDLPTNEEMTGAILTEQEDVSAFIEKSRTHILRERENNGQ